MAANRRSAEVDTIMELARSEFDDLQLSVAWNEIFRRPLRPDLQGIYHDVMAIVDRHVGRVNAKALSEAAARVLNERHVIEHLALGRRFGFPKELLPIRVAETASDVLEAHNRATFAEIYLQQLWDCLVFFRRAPMNALRDSGEAATFGEHQWRRAMTWLERNISTDDQVLFLVAPKTKGMAERSRAAAEDGFLSYANIATALGKAPREINALEQQARRLRKRFEERAKGAAL
jgi:hypothetical protein